MKRKILIFALLVVALAAIFAMSISAKEWTYKDEAGTTYLTLTIDDTSKIVTTYNGRFPMWNEQNQPLTWYVIATDDTNGIKTVKSFVSTDTAYTNHGDGYFRFIKAADFKVEGYPVPTKENVVSLNMPNNMGITAFSNYSKVNFQAATYYTPDKLELLFLRCPNTMTNTERLAQGSKILEVEFDKNSVCTEINYAAFFDCKSLRKVNIPASVQTIDAKGDNTGNAFHQCESLTELTFDEGSRLTTIRGGALKRAKLYEIQFPSSITTFNNNILSYTGVEIIRFPEYFTHFVNLNNDGSIRTDHHSFTYSAKSVKEYYLPVTFYATAPDTTYYVSHAFAGGDGNVKIFYCGTLEQFEKAKKNFETSITGYSTGNGNFKNAKTVSYETYKAAIALDATAYSDADYVIYGYNSCDAFHGGVHKFDKDCTTADACQNGCGLTATKYEAHNLTESVAYPNGFANSGIYFVACSNDNCDPGTQTTIEPIFTAKGYSTNPSQNSIDGGYTVHLTNLALYERLNGDIKYGIVIANAGKFGTNEFFDADNKVNTEKAIQIEIGSLYSNFDCTINFGANTGAEIDLIICAYVIDGDNVSFIQRDSGTDKTIGSRTFKTVTLEFVVASQPPASKDEE